MGPGSCYALPADLANFDDIVRLVKELEGKEKGESISVYMLSHSNRSFVAVLNVLVNNSGANWGAPLEEYPDDAFAKVSILGRLQVTQ